MNNISAFFVIQANVNMETSILNVTVLLRFMIQCTTHCQEMQVNKLKNITSMSLEPIVIVYNGYAHFHNVSLTGYCRIFISYCFQSMEFSDVFTVTSMVTTENTLSKILLIDIRSFHYSFLGPTSNTIQTTSPTIICKLFFIHLKKNNLFLADLSESIFEVFYKLELYDLIFDGDLQSGPITDDSTIADLTDLVSIIKKESIRD
jgi:hypothetical protein